MEMPINSISPLKMHIDLNSCFTTIEQQANPLIRHKPVVVAAYDTPKGMILAASYEAKAIGIKLGLSVSEGRKIYPGLIVMMPDPDKYFDANGRFRELLLKYTSSVVAKSVDEFAVDFLGSPAVRQGDSLEKVGNAIKQDIKYSLGEYVTVNVGIGSNRFLAKLAAGLNKPDGLDKITAENLKQTYSSLSLVDLPGINVRYQARLNLAGIYSPLDFLDAPLQVLRQQVFHSIVGYYWYLRLRGYEVDNVDFGRKTFGQQYALSKKTNDINELSRLLMKLCEKTGRRLRRAGFMASGIHLWLGFDDHSRWSHGKKPGHILYSTQSIYQAALKLLKLAVSESRVTNIAVSVYGLSSAGLKQLDLFADPEQDSWSLATAADNINDRYGEFSVIPALMANMQGTILKRVSFGKINDL
jgi:DNA polymerase-4